ncbi:HDIG domain-containing protein [Candidatus Woesearchaeota archaeon]|nr:HDIG domain-containing protein [Candidatus Woesearchaeota archaeon]
MESRIPSESECLELLSQMHLPPGVINHSIAVKNFALEMADRLSVHGIDIDRELIAASALLHDIMKVNAEVCHGIEGGEFLRKKGFHEVARVVEKHCLNNLRDPELVPKTKEEKLLMYADLKINGGKVVSLDDRFEYIRKVYKPGNVDRFNEYAAFARQLEWELTGSKEEKEM